MATATTPRAELMADDIVTIPSGKYPNDEWKIVETLGDCLDIERIYPRPGIVNRIQTYLPACRVD